jgi:AFG3 family protein
MSQEDLKPKERRGLPKMTPKDDNNNPKRGPRFSIYWVWGAIAAILLGFQFFGSGVLTPDAHRIAVKDFKEMLANGDVDKIVLI